MKELIREPDIERGQKGEITRVAVAFGPHYFIEIMPDENSGKLTLYLGATHHGFRAEATEIMGQLEMIIGEVQDSHPELSF